CATGAALGWIGFHSW
nr:immunoglobulin heavy chain junction region [Macaca mulatta]MOV35604.1 immunoglobulin heavy chain junction region [Macaca mulatta]MOV35617.1 immunoglobulin heavy chain junction region [Macaca mulatta]MOV35628.1 immunoglobulin heavy chain junction region [Macaca mulatta]MOV35630.1 immunoglobulin heavy chain junction region [Macaca mulatta]